MKAIKQRPAVFLSLFFLLFGNVVLAQTAYTLPPGTVIRVKMDNELTSRTANKGDTFTATVVGAVYVRGVEVITAESLIEGRVLESARAGRGGKSGWIKVALEKLKLRNGTAVAIEGLLTQTGSETADDIFKGAGASATNAAIFGGALGAGALIGGAADKANRGRGIAVGAAVGAGIGGLAYWLRRGEDVTIKANTEFGVALKREVTLPAKDF